MSPFWLYLHFPSLQLDALQKSAAVQEENATLPIVILDKNKNEVCQLNALALEKGLSLGMGLATAALLSPDLIVVPYHQKGEEKTLSEIAEALYNTTSDITLFPPNGVLLRIHNMLSLYGGLDAYWTALKLQLNPLKIQYHYATGTTPYAARLLAQSQRNIVTNDARALKKILNHIPLTQTDLPAKAVIQLKRTGIEKIGELFNVPKGALAKRFDIKFNQYLRRLSGELSHPVEFFRPKEKFERELTLLFDVEHSPRLIKPIAHLLEMLERFLRHRDWLTYNVLITLHLRDAQPLTMDIGSAQGDYKASAWLELAKLKLEKLTLDAPTFALTLYSGVIQQRHSDISDLFNSSAGALSYAQLLSLLNAKLGENKLFHPEAINDHRPEAVCEYRPAMAQKIELNPPKLSPEKERLRPSFLFSPPRPLKEKTTLIFGPERLCSGWWENKAFLRDYFIARTQKGRLYWVFRTPKKNRWFVHGIFS